jgi:O-antigen ligase
MRTAKSFKYRNACESIVVIFASIFMGLMIGLLTGLSFKFQLALMVGSIGLLVIYFIPQRRTFCLFIYILIQPLSIEKILYTAPSVYGDLRGAEIVLNAGDLILILLAFILFIESKKESRSIFIWDKKFTLILLMAIWASVSYLIHLLFYKNDFVDSSPLGIFHYLRILLFSLIVMSAIKTKADIIWILIALLISLSLQSLLVSISFATSKIYNFTSLLGGPTVTQSYSGTGGDVVRGVGTLGIANQQALYHAMFTFLLVTFFAVKRAAFRYLALAVILASFMAVIFTFSRSAWLAIFLGGLIIALTFFKRGEIKPISWLVGAIVMIGAAIVLGIVAQLIIDRLTKGDEGATDSRMRMIVLAKDLFLNHPIIGVGPAGYIEAGLSIYPPGYKPTEWVPLGSKPIVPPLGRIELAVAVIPGQKPIVIPLAVHNKFMLMLAELGIVGLALWVLLFYSFYKDSKHCSRAKEPFYRYLGVAGLGTMAVAIAYMNLDLFSDTKTVQVLLLPLLIVGSARRLSQEGK